MGIPSISGSETLPFRRSMSPLYQRSSRVSSAPEAPKKQAPSKTGPSGVGRENYTWYLRHVHLVPLSWEDEVRLLKRELDRAHASLRREEDEIRGLVGD